MCRIVAMFLSHYPSLDLAYLRGGWAPGYEEHEYEAIEVESASFADDVAAAALMDLGL